MSYELSKHFKFITPSGYHATIQRIDPSNTKQCLIGQINVDGSPKDVYWNLDGRSSSDIQAFNLIFSEESKQDFQDMMQLYHFLK